MAGAALSRIFTSIKLASAFNVIHTAQTNEGKIADAKSRASASLLAQTLSMAGRKDSYASVREGSDGLQSFRLRKPQSTSFQSPRPSIIQRKASFASDEDAVLDDSDISPQESLYEASLYSSSDARPCPTSLDDMPAEILTMIFDLVQVDTTIESYLRPEVDLYNLLLVSKSVHAAALQAMYRHVAIFQSRAFHKLSNTIDRDPDLANLIHCLDLSHYSNMGYRRSSSATNATPYLTKATLQQLLQHTTNLRAFLSHEHIHDELDLSVLKTLFNISSLRAIDFSGCISQTFSSAFTALTAENISFSHLRRLCFHECATLKSAVFESILPQLQYATHLDLAHTAVTDQALLSLPSTARLTHLNLERCTQITGPAVVDFLTTHPAAQTLVWLNLNADPSRYRLLQTHDLDILLPHLPQTLKSLNIGGAQITKSHVPELQHLATQVEELGLKGAKLDLDTDIAQVLGLNKPSLSKHTVHYLDLADVDSVSYGSLLFSKVTSASPLEVLELSPKVRDDITRSHQNSGRNEKHEWTVRENGRRGWYVRVSQGDDGYRPWKMGARWWGMRKCPVVKQDVNGMYGYFMFKRN